MGRNAVKDFGCGAGSDLRLALTEHVLIKRQSLGFAINPDALAIPCKPDEPERRDQEQIGELQADGCQSQPDHQVLDLLFGHWLASPNNKKAAPPAEETTSAEATWRWLPWGHDIQVCG